MDGMFLQQFKHTVPHLGPRVNAGVVHYKNVALFQITPTNRIDNKVEKIPLRIAVLFRPMLREKDQ